jgi:hypothetical protein
VVVDVFDVYPRAESQEIEASGETAGQQHHLSPV